MGSHSMADRERIHGVDFSGAADAGRKIWVASGAAEEDTLVIRHCRRGDTLPGSGRDRDRCLAALRTFVQRERAGVFGFDFPFGLPRTLVKQASWEDFVLTFPGRYPGPEAFRHACREATAGSELKRTTDVEARTPFSPYNIRLFRQTYYGIRDVLHPLVRDRLACVLPMQRVSPRKPWILEICPASTLKREELYLQGYKRHTDEAYAARERILDAVESTGLLTIPSRTLRSAVLDDGNGDALDSIIAAFATFRALRRPDGLTVDGSDAYALEGYVYV